jgi:hypothetical protein
LASLAQSFEKIVTIHIVMVNVFPAIAPAHDVINGSSVFDSQLARHGPEPAPITSIVNALSGKVWVDPFDGLTPLMMG